jgi:hypothetical protein
VAPDALAPDVLVDAAEATLLGLAPAGFFVLGVQLAAEGMHFPPPISAPLAVVVVLRMAVAPLLLLALAAAATLAWGTAFALGAALVAPALT